MAQLSWTPDHILKSHPVAQCPHNPFHFVPEVTLKKHAHACQLRKRGCSKEDLVLQLQDDDFCYEKAELVGKVKLDEGLLNSIIWNHCMENGQVYTGHRPLPVTAEDARIQLLREERLAVYDYCVQQLKAQNKMANIEKDEVLTTDWEKIIKKGLLDAGGDKPKTEAELMTMLRDQKRRRQSYRAKNVHVTKKSYTEIIREVISNQMEILMGPEEHDDRPAEGEGQSQGLYSKGDRSPSYSRRSANSQTRSRSRSPQRRRDRDMSRGESRSSDRSYREYDKNRRGRREQKGFREHEDRDSNQRKHRDYRESKERYDDGRDYRERKERDDDRRIFREKEHGDLRESKSSYRVKEEKIDKQDDIESVQRSYSERRFRDEDHTGKDQRDARERRFREKDYAEQEQRGREKDARDLGEPSTSNKGGEGSSVLDGAETRNDSDVSDSHDSTHSRRRSKSSKKKKKHKHKKHRSKHARTDSESND